MKFLVIFAILIVACNCKPQGYYPPASGSRTRVNVRTVNSIPPSGPVYPVQPVRPIAPPCPPAQPIRPIVPAYPSVQPVRPVVPAYPPVQQPIYPTFPAQPTQFPIDPRSQTRVQVRNVSPTGQQGTTRVQVQTRRG